MTEKTDVGNGRGEGEQLPETIAFDYIKSSGFRVVKVDGAYGGVSPRGEVAMSLWNERKAIPQRVVHSVTPDGKVGKEIESDRVTRDAIVREVEVCAFMSLQTAETIGNWLLKNVEEIRNLQMEMQEGKSHEDPTSASKDSK